jgi:hypothetical protein
MFLLFVVHWLVRKLDEVNKYVLRKGEGVSFTQQLQCGVTFF